MQCMQQGVRSLRKETPRDCPPFCKKAAFFFLLPSPMSRITATLLLLITIFSPTREVPSPPSAMVALFLNCLGSCNAGTINTSSSRGDTELFSRCLDGETLLRWPLVPLLLLLLLDNSTNAGQ